MTSITKITIHWTGGGYFPNIEDFAHYHFIVDKNGKTVNGFYKPEDNLNCKDGKYAQHTGGGNTGNIGIAMCAMAGFKDRNNIGEYPITNKQFEACMEYVAKLCLKYGIRPTEQNVFTHYEFGLKNPTTSSKGKIDITYIPPYPQVKKEQCGQFIRQKVQWYTDKLKKEKEKSNEMV
mgnify:CR=1 FL=1